MDIAEIFKELLTKKEGWRSGVWSGFFIIILILVIISSGTIHIPLTWQGTSYQVSSLGEKPVFWLHSYENPAHFSFAILNQSGECIDILIKRGNGLRRTGTYCENDNIIVDDQVLEITDIKVGTNIEKPITITHYKTVNLGGLFTILLFVIPLIAIWDKVSQIKARKYDEEYKKKMDKLSKKLKTTPEVLEELKELLSEE